MLSPQSSLVFLSPGGILCGSCYEVTFIIIQGLSFIGSEHGSCHMLLHMNPALVLHVLKTFLMMECSCWHEILTSSFKNCLSFLAKEWDFLSCSLILLTPQIMMLELIFVVQQKIEPECQLSSPHKPSIYFHMFRNTDVPLCMYDIGSFMKSSVGSYITRCIVRSRII
jgi:hypothetical protein